MKAKNLLLIAVAALSLAGCKYDDDAIWDAVNKQEERISALETWQKQASQEIAALKAITDESDYILSIDSIMDGTTRTGYTITFKKSGTITLMNGQKGDKGDTPLISLQQGKDGNWYWTLNGDLMTDANGAPIRANGAVGTPAPTPQLKTGSQLKAASIPGTWQTDAFYLSVDNGKTWNKVSGDKGEKGDKGDTGATGATGAPGSSGSGGGVFSGIDISKPSVAIFTLPDGRTTFTVPRYEADALNLVIKNSSNIPVDKDIAEIMAFSRTADFFYFDLASGSTIVVIPPTGWTAILDREQKKITIGSPSEDDYSSNSQLAGPVETVVVVSSGNGLNAFYTIRTMAISNDFINCNADNLIDMLDKHSDVKKLKVSGALTTDQMAKIKNDLKSSLVEIDLEEATLDGGIPYSQFNSFSNLTTVKLPKGLTKIGASAFSNCPLTTITIGEGLTYIGVNAFSGCTSLKTITLPSSLENIEGNIFSGCSALESITCEAMSPPKYQGSDPSPSLAFLGLASLKNIYVPAGSVSAYQGDSFWKQYSNKITAITQ